MSDAGLQFARETFYHTTFDMIREDTIMMQIQYIIENDLFFKELFFLKWWAGLSCRFNSSWLTAHLIRVWHTTEKMRFWLNVWNKRTVRDEQMPPFISSVWCSSKRLHWTTRTTERRGKHCTVEEQHGRLPCVIGWGWKEREGDGAPWVLIKVSQVKPWVFPR